MSFTSASKFIRSKRGRGAGSAGIQDVVYLSIVGHEYLTWTALLDKRSALPVAYIPVDPS